MNRTVLHGLMAGALAFAALGGGVASAQNHDNHDNHDNHGNNNGGHDDHHPGPVAQHGGGPGPQMGHNHWQKGQRLPVQFRDRSRYVDYRQYHLRAPPRGYQWVRTDDNNYALVALTTGLISELIAASR